jgi:hypothetical protein
MMEAEQLSSEGIARGSGQLGLCGRGSDSLLHCEAHEHASPILKPHHWRREFAAPPEQRSEQTATLKEAVLQVAVLKDLAIVVVVKNPWWVFRPVFPC